MQQEGVIDQDIIIEKLLNGVPVEDFIAFYIAAFVGFAIVYLFIDVRQGVKKSPSTPNKWNWRAFFKGWKNMMGSMLLIAVGIVFWPNISTFMLETEEPVNLTIWSAFIVGVSLDRLRAYIHTLRSGNK
jgi:putative Mn2+ efflux pump MntP